MVEFILCTFTLLVSVNSDGGRRLADCLLAGIDSVGATDTAELKFVFNAVEESIKAANFAQTVRCFAPFPG